MKPTKKDIEAAKKKAKDVEKKTSLNNVRMSHIDEIWDEIGEINKAIDRIYNRLGLE